MHHRRRGVALVAATALLVVAAGGCSRGDDASGSKTTGSNTPEGSTRPTDSIVPGGTTPSTTGPGPTTTTLGNGGGDPSEGIPRDQFCRALGQVRLAEKAMTGALGDDDVAAFKTAYRRLLDSYLAMAENPPDEVYDEVRAVYFLFDDLTGQITEAETADELTTIALQAQGGERAEDLEAVRDYAAANC